MGKNINLIETGDAIANRLLALSSNNEHQNQGNLNISICHTGEININMIERILENKNIEVRNCTI
jgi:glutamate racemase